MIEDHDDNGFGSGRVWVRSYPLYEDENTPPAWWFDVWRVIEDRAKKLRRRSVGFLTNLW